MIDCSHTYFLQAMYGSMLSFEGCNAFKEMLEVTDIGLWYGKMKQAVTTSKGANNINIK